MVVSSALNFVGFVLMISCHSSSLWISFCQVYMECTGSKVMQAASLAEMSSLAMVSASWRLPVVTKTMQYSGLFIIVVFVL